MTLNGIIAVTLRYFSEFDSFRMHCVKVVEDIPKTFSNRNVVQSFDTVSQKNGATLTMAITLPILGGFAKFFHCWKGQ